MPYTASHAIAVFPFWAGFRRWLPLPALIVGSLSPDFPYFVALTPIYAPGHFVDGLFLYCVLPSLAVLGIWYRWLEKPMLSLLRLPIDSGRFSITRLLSLVAAVTLGALTHILWDASSHDYGWIVDRYAWLRAEALGLPLYQWNQYLSSVLGLAALAVWYVRSRDCTGTEEPQTHEYRAATGIGVVVTLLFTGLAIGLYDVRTFEDFVVQSSVGAGTGAALAVVVYSVWANRRTSSRQTPGD